MPRPTQSSPVPRPVSIPSSPSEVAAAIRPLDGFFFLDSSQPEAGMGAGSEISVIGAEPGELLEGNLAEDRDRSRLRRAMDGMWGGRQADWGIPLGGLFGSVDFDGSFRFGRYEDLLVYRHDRGEWLAVGEGERLLGAEIHFAPAVAPVAFSAGLGRNRFCEMVRRAKEYIAAGDIYQVNLSQRFTAPWANGADPFELYRRLRDCSPAPYSAFFDLADRQVVSASLECFLDLSGSRIRTRPIKGTRPRHQDPGADERSAYELMTSPKEIAELVMITDLERNDLGQVCEFGSVRVAELLKLERFAQVFHLVSTVEGQLRSGVDHLDALAACFPGGSISGAPKPRALEILDELEPEPRGLFTGAIGYLGANGESQFSIAIRTAVVEGGEISLHTGAGIVADSDPDAEYEETLHKAAGMFAAAEGCGGVSLGYSQQRKTRPR